MQLHIFELSFVIMCTWKDPNLKEPIKLEALEFFVEEI